MLYFGVVFNKDLEERKRDPFIPLGWPMYLTPMKADEVPVGGVNKLSLDQIQKIQEDLWDEYYRLQQEYKEYYIEDRLRVLDLVHEDFKNLHPSKIDFTRHLKNGIFLEKREVEMLKNGRPVRSVYYHGSDKVAEIQFSFETDALNFMTRRTERLGYYSNDNDLHDLWVISDEFFSATNAYQHKKRLEERTNGRGWIIDSLRADVDKFLTASAQQNPTMSGTISAMINAFWVEYNPHISAFISAGGTYLRTKFQNDSTYPFLNSEVAPGITVRAYIVDKLTY